MINENENKISENENKISLLDENKLIEFIAKEMRCSNVIAKKYYLRIIKTLKKSNVLHKKKEIFEQYLLPYSSNYRNRLKLSYELYHRFLCSSKLKSEPKHRAKCKAKSKAKSKIKPKTKPKAKANTK